MKSITKGIGNNCPKCNLSMIRKCHHPDVLIKKVNRTYYFFEWDTCKTCRVVQHYEKFKVFSIEIEEIQ